MINVDVAILPRHHEVAAGEAEREHEVGGDVAQIDPAEMGAVRISVLLAEIRNVVQHKRYNAPCNCQFKSDREREGKYCQTRQNAR